MILATVLLSSILVLSNAQDDEPQPTPDALLISPVPRKHTPHNIRDERPCSGMEKGLSHLLAEPGSLNPISWKIDVPDATATCTIRMSNENDFGNFTTLLPTDGTADSKGVFPCGREKIYSETKNVIFPEYTCDECTLQWIWFTESGTFYQCADVQITDSYQASCYGKCKNGGVCSDGMCKCPEGYRGDYCQKVGDGQPWSPEIGNQVYVFFGLLGILLILVIAVVIYVNYIKLPRACWLWFKRHLPMCFRVSEPEYRYWNDDNLKLEDDPNRAPVPA